MNLLTNNMSNWIENTENIDWKNLSEINKRENEMFMIKTAGFIIKTDKYWLKCAQLVDICPNKELVVLLANARWTLFEWEEIPKKTFYHLTDMIEEILKCQNVPNQNLYLKTIFDKWGQDLFLVMFDSKGLFNNWYEEELFNNIIERMSKIIPNQMKEYFNSDIGKSFLRTMNRINDVGFCNKMIANKINEIVERLELPKIQYEKVDIDDIFARAGWKKMESKQKEFDANGVEDILKIDEMCYLTNPCQHNVDLLMKNHEKITKLMSRPDIIKLCEKLKKQIPIPD